MASAGYVVAHVEDGTNTGEQEFAHIQPRPQMLGTITLFQRFGAKALGLSAVMFVAAVVSFGPPRLTGSARAAPVRGSVGLWDSTQRDVSSTSPNGTDPVSMHWAKHSDTFLNLYARGDSAVTSLEQAKARCMQYGLDCLGVTCGYDANFGTGHAEMSDPESSCTVREGRCAVHALYSCPPGKTRGLQPSPTHEVTYLKVSKDSPDDGSIGIPKIY
mmetsp:Transcript_5401/g.15046  ORF Transcript_5401/g.15046 Transcript_5401/m.15046 type:complete len:216 (-) Transcript_5401:105-752(-)